MEYSMISVIVPVYNVEPYLDKCVSSILGQTYPDLEVILVDDGSTDRSPALCDEWAGKDGRVTVIHKENGGLSDARNAGLDRASGQWLSFVDSDDFLAPDTLGRLYEAAIQNQCQISVCNMVRIYEDSVTEPFYRPADQLTLLPGPKRFETLKQPSVCNKLFHRTLFAGVRFPVGKYYEDTFVYHVLAHRAENAVLTGQDGYYYLSRRGSILGTDPYSDRYFDCVEAVYLRMTYLLDQGVSDYGREACLSLYAAMSNAVKSIPRTRENRAKFQAAKRWYAQAYDCLMSDDTVGLKQKLRLVLLRYAPGLHRLLY